MYVFFTIIFFGQLTDFSQRFSDARRVFSGFRHQGTSSTVDPLDEWLATPPVITASPVNPITFWSNMKASGHALADMALDYLSAAGTSVFCLLCLGVDAYGFFSFKAASTDVERAFSRGGLTVSKLRHNLNNDSTKASSILGDWHKVPGLVPVDEILDTLTERRRRTKKPRIEDSEPVIEL